MMKYIFLININKILVNIFQCFLIIPISCSTCHGHHCIFVMCQLCFWHSTGPTDKKCHGTRVVCVIWLIDCFLGLKLTKAATKGLIMEIGEQSGLTSLIGKQLFTSCYLYSIRFSEGFNF